MPASLVPDILRMRRTRAERVRKSRITRMRQFALVLTGVLSALFALGAITATYVYTTLARDLPSLQTLPLLLAPETGLLYTPSEILDRTGTITLFTLRNPAVENHTYISVNPVARHPAPPALVDATLALADPEFWTHSGYTDLFSPTPQTLAEQLALNFLLWDEPEGMLRTLRARMMAAQLTQEFGREQILDWYLNSTNYGHLAHGADAGSRTYFRVPVEELTETQAITLAAIGQAPDLNPIDSPELTRERLTYALDQMLLHNYLSADEHARLARAPLAFDTTQDRIPTEIAPFLRLVQTQLPDLISFDRLAQGGLRVVTTLDAELQTQAICAAETQLQRLQGMESTTDDACQTARLLPNLFLEATISEGLSAEVAALTPETGQVLALAKVGDASQVGDTLNAHPPGSLLSPYVYLSGFTRGFGPSTLVWDIPSNLPTNVENPNKDGAFFGPVRMRIALANDYLIPALNLLGQLGAENVWQTARQLGLASLEVPAGSASQQLLLEGGEIPLLEVVQAYGIFSAQGVWIGRGEETGPLKPITILRVEDVEGNIVATMPPPQARPITTAQVAYLMTHILSDETARWPSLGHPNSLEIGRPAAAKLGATQAGADAWTVGYTPSFSLGVWMGQGDASSAVALSPLAPAGIWHAVMQYRGQFDPDETWPVPPGISTITVCDPSGLLPTTECPQTVAEVFLPGTEPTRVDTLYQKYQINRETGLLATVFTPANLIDEQVYLVPPPEASDWAQQAGLPIPPEAYDLVSAPSAGIDGVALSSPGMFSYVSGEVDIIGTADIVGFDRYFVQVGQGLNPQQWVQLATPSETSVRNERLATWDTTEQSGLYAIRLSVVDGENRLRSAILQVTVDNTPPALEILNPTQGATISAGTNRITLQFNATDNLGVTRVEVELDGDPLATITQPPYVLPWRVTPGTHELVVTAYDFAGNATTVSLEFDAAE